MESEEFMLLPANQLIDIISSDELNVRSEEQVFNAVMAWVKYSIQERRPQLPQVRPKNIFLHDCTYANMLFCRIYLSLLLIYSVLFVNMKKENWLFENVSECEMVAHSALFCMK